MAGVKISNLPAATIPLTGAELIAVVQGGVTSKATVTNAQTTVSGGTTGLTPATATAGAVTLAGTLAVANGGTNATATPTAGTVPYGTGTAYAFSAVGTVGQVLQSNGASAPTWATVTGTGTVTSVAATVPAFLSVTGSPITAAGTLALATLERRCLSPMAAQTLSPPALHRSTTSLATRHRARRAPQVPTLCFRIPLRLPALLLLQPKFWLAGLRPVQVHLAFRCLETLLRLRPA